MIKYKKGELTTKQLVTLIVLITSFVIILLLIWRLNLGKETDQEICRNSVILRAKSATLSGPLDCKTNYLCISGGRECEGFPSTKEEINLDDKNDKEEVMKIIANEMSDCWWKFAEGQANYGTKQGTSVKYALCSKLKFDEDLQKEISEISYSEFYTYLEKNEKEEGLSYLKYLYGVNSLSSLRIEEEFKVSIAQDSIKTNEEYSIFTGIDDNISPFDDEILHVYIIPSLETKQRLTDDRETITTA